MTIREVVLCDKQTHAIGVKGFSCALQKGERVFRIALDTIDLSDPAVRVALVVNLSLDGGVTWNNPPDKCAPFPVSITLEGGALDRQGLPLAATDISSDVPDVDNPNRVVSAALTMTTKSFQAAAKVVVTT